MIASGGRRLGLQVAVLGAYAALVLVFCWPLPARISTHITGSPGGDAGAYVWNLWVFRHEVLSGSLWPFGTQQILAFSGPVDLSQHNYTAFADLLSLPLQERLGIIASFNLIYLALRVSSAYAMFLLASALVGARVEAFLAGALFGFSPFLTARGTAHYSLVAAAPLPLFVLCLWQAGRSGRWPWAVAAGLTLGWSAYCDPYYVVFCLMILGAALAHAAVDVSCEPSALGTGCLRRRALAGVFGTCVLASGLIGLGIAATGGTRISLAGFTLTMKSHYTPALVFALTLLGYAAVRTRVRLRLRPDFALVPSVRLLLIGLASGTMLLAPLLVALARRVLDGRFTSPPVLWRSSPPGVDLLAFLMPNPSHALFGEPYHQWLARIRADGFVENAASLTLTAIAVVGLAYWRRLPMPRAWLGFTVFFGALALGPFVWVGGFNMALPTPWTLLRYLPGVGLVRSPTRFAIVVMLGFAVLFAIALRELAARATPARRLALLGGVGALLAFELAPLPRTLYAADVPLLYAAVAADPCDVRVLELPFGLRDGTRSVGDFSALAQFHQTLHGKPLLGGYLSRISERRVAENRRFPFTSALITLSEGRALTADAAARARRAAGFFERRTRLGFVVIDRSRASRKLRRFAIGALELERIDEQWPYELLVPRAARCGGSSRGGCAHTWPGCPLRIESNEAPAAGAPEPRRPGEAQGIRSSAGSAAPSLERSTGRVAPPSER